MSKTLSKILESRKIINKKQFSYNKKSVTILNNNSLKNKNKNTGPSFQYLK